MEIRKKIFIATPMYNSVCSGYYTRSLASLIVLLLSKGYEVRFQDLYNETLVTRARNHLTESFLRNEYDYLLFIDADQGFDPEGVVKMIEEDVDVIAGVVPLKIINWESIYTVANKGIKDLQNYGSIYNVNSNENTEINKDDKFEVSNAGTGLILIKKEVFEKMKPLVNTYKFSSTEVLDIKPGDTIYNFWDTSISEDGVPYGEDYQFCNLWKSLGGKIYATFWPKATHMGNYIYK